MSGVQMPVTVVKVSPEMRPEKKTRYLHSAASQNRLTIELQKKPTSRVPKEQTRYREYRPNSRGWANESSDPRCREKLVNRGVCQNEA